MYLMDNGMIVNSMVIITIAETIKQSNGERTLCRCGIIRNKTTMWVHKIISEYLPK